MLVLSLDKSYLPLQASGVGVINKCMYVSVFEDHMLLLLHVNMRLLKRQNLKNRQRS